MITKRRLINKLKRLHTSFTLWFNSVGVIWLQSALLEPSLLDWLTTHQLIWIIIIGNILIRVFKTEKAIEDK